jgi:hypothetical protein
LFGILLKKKNCKNVKFYYIKKLENQRQSSDFDFDLQQKLAFLMKEKFKKCINNSQNQTPTFFFIQLPIN